LHTRKGDLENNDAPNRHFLEMPGDRRWSDRRSLNHKLCWLGSGIVLLVTHSAPYEKSKSLGSDWISLRG